MSNIFLFGIFWTIYGVLGLFGIQKISDKYKNKEWTKQYIRTQGISKILLGIPWIILFFITRKIQLNYAALVIYIVICGIPAIIFSKITETKFKRCLKE